MDYWGVTPRTRKPRRAGEAPLALLRVKPVPGGDGGGGGGGQA